MSCKKSRRNFLKKASLGVASLALGSTISCSNESNQKPNIVIIFTDDQGYEDVGEYGAEGFQTPNLDKMADNGMVFTDFHVAASVCTPSRAALLTGCYPQRVGLQGVLFPEGPEWTKGYKSQAGINQNEVTIAEMLKKEGYSTSCIGKWHLGHHKKFLPPNHGFDEYFGLPYSNDMRPENNEAYPPLPLIEGTEVIEKNPDQSQLTRRYTKRAVDFINRNQDNPFFLYLAHTMPHVPLYCSDRFKGSSEQGMYGDVMQEIDWSAGRVIEALKKNGLEDNTLVIFTSDNGPWTVYGNHAGSVGELRGCKQTTFEGGLRVPCIMKWPGKIPANTVCEELATTMDILPTVSKITGAQLPQHKIDGHDIRSLIFNKEGESPYEVFYFYDGKELKAVRKGKWKLHLKHEYRGVKEPGMNGKKGEYFNKTINRSLFNLEEDIDENKDVSQENPQIVQELLEYAKKARKELGDINIEGDGVRPYGKVN